MQEPSIKVNISDIKVEYIMKALKSQALFSPYIYPHLRKGKSGLIYSGHPNLTFLLPPGGKRLYVCLFVCSVSTIA